MADLTCCYLSVAEHGSSSVKMIDAAAQSLLQESKTNVLRPGRPVTDASGERLVCGC